jgi:hypothetical protein
MQVVEVVYGQNRSEDFFLHHQTVLPGALHDYRPDEPALFVDGPSPVDDPAAVVVSQQSFNALHMEPIDDFTVIAVILQALVPLEELLQGSKEGSPEVFLHGLMDVDMVDADAGLPAVEKFPKQDAVDRRADLCAFIHNDRTLAAQL